MQVKEVFGFLIGIFFAVCGFVFAFGDEAKAANSELFRSQTVAPDEIDALADASGSASQLDRPILIAGRIPLPRRDARFFVDSTGWDDAGVFFLRTGRGAQPFVDPTTDYNCETNSNSCLHRSLWDGAISPTSPAPLPRSVVRNRLWNGMFSPTSPAFSPRPVVRNSSIFTAPYSPFRTSLPRIWSVPTSECLTFQGAMQENCKHNLIFPASAQESIPTLLPRALRRSALPRAQGQESTPTLLPHRTLLEYVENRFHADTQP